MWEGLKLMWWIDFSCRDWVATRNSKALALTSSAGRGTYWHPSDFPVIKWLRTSGTVTATNPTRINLFGASYAKITSDSLSCYRTQHNKAGESEEGRLKRISWEGIIIQMKCCFIMDWGAFFPFHLCAPISSLSFTVCHMCIKGIKFEWAFFIHAMISDEIDKVSGVIHIERERFFCLKCSYIRL